MGEGWCSAELAQQHIMSQGQISLQCFGHGIMDVDIEELIVIGDGEIVTTTISSIIRGERNNPGELRGSIKNSRIIGTLHSNTHFGVYGTLINHEELNIPEGESLEVASRHEIETGLAKVILSIEDNERKEYSIEIVRIYRNNNSDNKSMLIRITDEALLGLTGGIVQGMSGAPIIQERQIYTVP